MNKQATFVFLVIGTFIRAILASRAQTDWLVKAHRTPQRKWKHVLGGTRFHNWRSTR
jgi:hypothetical protein